MEEPLAESGLLEGGVLTCSKHLWQWNLRTGEMVGMAEKPLLTYEIKREGDEVLANMESELVYDYDEEDEMDDDNFFAAD
jgi:toluene monooxygenase system ferredoxin subunit